MTVPRDSVLALVPLFHNSSPGAAANSSHPTPGGKKPNLPTKACRPDRTDGPPCVTEVE